ncbi:hypothetical protein R83H12_03102 [Fibrobacteria bacterium R8-3-H12]
MIDNNIYSFDFVLVLPFSNEKIETAFNTKLNGRKGYIAKGEEAKEILDLYSLYEFSSNIIIGSFDKPYGRKLQNILNSGIASEDTLINDIILGALNGRPA